MQPLFEYRREFAGYDTRVLELEGKGTPLVFFHGFSDSADTWRHTLDVLGRHDRRAIAVDLPGFATAARLRAGLVLPQLDAFAAAVVAGVEGDERPVAVGNSLGGCVALRLGERAGERLSGIVAVAPAGLDMAGWFSLIERDVLLRTILASPVPVPPPVLRALVGRIYRFLAFADPARVEPKVITAFASHHGDRATVARYMDTGRRMIPELRDPFDLPRVSPPVLLVWGDRDRLVFSSGAQRVIDALPGTRLELFEGCGHCPQIEAAGRFAALLEEFAEAPAAAV
jgi:pimeloyl-ACP methyl ester carboxylesterase